MPVDGQVVAVDVGGTGIKAALCHDRSPYEPITEIRRPTPVAAGVPAVVTAIVELVSELATDSVRGVGVIMPGVVDPDTGIAHYATNIGWRDLPIRQQLSDRTGLPVAIEHDVRAAGLAEAELGAARGADSALFVAIGTGIAAATVLDGRLVRGAGQLAGEIGHVPVFPGGETCACGQRGCTETYASAAALARRYQGATGRAEPAERVIALARQGDPVATTVFDDAVTALARALVFATMLLDPALIVIGGGLSLAGDTLLDPVREHLHSALAWRAAPPLRTAAFGARSGQVGAALIGSRAARR